MLLAIQVLTSFAFEEMLPTLKKSILAAFRSFGRGERGAMGFETLDRLQIHT